MKHEMARHRDRPPVRPRSSRLPDVQPGFLKNRKPLIISLRHHRGQHSRSESSQACDRQEFSRTAMNEDQIQGGGEKVADIDQHLIKPADLPALVELISTHCVASGGDRGDEGRPPRPRNGSRRSNSGSLCIAQRTRCSFSWRLPGSFPLWHRALGQASFFAIRTRWQTKYK